MQLGHVLANGIDQSWINRVWLRNHLRALGNWSVKRFIRPIKNTEEAFIQYRVQIICQNSIKTS